ncbi:GIP, partial [Symbiodinium necroappetens]
MYEHGCPAGPGTVQPLPPPAQAGEAPGETVGKPALADVSDTSEELWQRTVDEATSWYNQIETMIIAAAPKEIREEVSASRFLQQAIPEAPAVEQEQQALQLIAELEAARLGEFQHQLHTFECQLEAKRDPVDPSKAWERFANTGARRDALCALFAQPYLCEVPEDIKASLAESIPAGEGSEDGKSVLKVLPLRRSSRRLLLNSDRWVVHLCSGKPRSPEPLKEWSDHNGMLMLHVDILEKGGRGWDLLKQQGVWRALLWAASKGKIAAVLSSPPRYKEGETAKLPLQAMVLWSFASVMRRGGIPYLAEQPGLPVSIQSSFGKWSGTEVLSLSQGALGDEFSRPTTVQTNLDLRYVSTLPVKGKPEVPPNGREWTLPFRKEVVRALRGCPSTPSCEELDRVIVEAKETTASGRCEEAQPCIGKVDDASLEEWREHILNGHVPYRKDCRRCIEGAGLGIQHRKVKYPHSYALSADLFGPVPPDQRTR